MLHICNGLVKEREAHVFVFLFFLLSSSWGSSSSISTSRGGSGGGSSECFWVGKYVLNLVSQWEAVFCRDSNGQEVLVSIDDGVRSRGKRWHSSLLAEGGNSLDSSTNNIAQLIVGDIQHGGVIDISILVDLLHHETVGEWLDSELGEKCCLGGSHLFSLSHHLNIRCNLNSTLGNLGWDVEDLEEGCLRGIHSSVSGWNGDTAWSNGSHLCWSSNLEL
mmetsp:Transcript_6602/g.13107  ORF Transcript_6602/g.13107 Transcript_6602/m.13107 type:complete len:219 (-) Transcript_6602:446-1102(-)